MEVPFWTLSRQYNLLRKEILEKIDEVLKTGEYVLGHYVRQFEQEFAKYCGAKYAVGVNSGTDAIVLALRAINVQLGDEVIVPALTFISTANAVTFCGGVPIFVDVEPNTLNMDPSSCNKQLQEERRRSFQSIFTDSLRIWIPSMKSPRNTSSW
jgi:dTDP-4-amino-4,6-dideoxygalactose transaminase